MPLLAWEIMFSFLTGLEFLLLCIGQKYGADDLTFQLSFISIGIMAGIAGYKIFQILNIYKLIGGI